MRFNERNAYETALMCEMLITRRKQVKKGEVEGISNKTAAIYDALTDQVGPELIPILSSITTSMFRPVLQSDMQNISGPNLKNSR